MLQLGLRFVKRFAILVPGILITIFSVRNVFPYFDNRLPQALAIFLTYVVTAYVLIPAIIRLIRIVWPPTHLPLYCITPDGFASDPLNIALIGTRREIIMAMEKAGWYMADPHNSIRNTARHVLSTIMKWQYLTAPVSSLFLFGRKQDLAFQLPIKGESSDNRHHVRFWATTFDDRKELHVNTIHWHKREAQILSDKLLWVGAASRDVGISPIRHNFQLTHMIAPDTNGERELIISDLHRSGLVDTVHRVKLGEPYKLINRAFRGQLHTDGIMTVVKLKVNAKTKA
jgi:hypothetical protein